MPLILRSLATLQFIMACLVAGRQRRRHRRTKNLQKHVVRLNTITIILIAFGLAMDAFAVSITSGLAIKNLKITAFSTLAASLNFSSWGIRILK